MWLYLALSSSAQLADSEQLEYIIVLYRDNSNLQIANNVYEINLCYSLLMG